MDMEKPQPDVMARLAESITAHEQELGKWQEEISAELAAARECVEQPPEENATKVHDPAMVSEEAAQLQSALEARIEEVAGLEASIATYQEQVRSLKNGLAETEEQLAATQTMLEQRSAQLALLSPAIAERDDRIQALQSEMQELRAKNEFLAARQTENSGNPPLAEPDAFSVERDAAAAHAAALEADLRDEQEHTAALEKELEALRERVQSAEEEIRRLRSESGNGPKAQPRRVDLNTIDAFDTQGHKKRIGQILVESGIISEYQLNELLSEQEKDPKRRLGALVVEKGHTSDYVIARILASQLRLPFSELRDEEIEPAAFALVSGHLARTHRCVPIRKRGDTLVLAMVNPLDLIAIEDVELATSCRVDPVVATAAAIDFAISRHSI